MPPRAKGLSSWHLFPAECKIILKAFEHCYCFLFFSVTLWLMLFFEKLRSEVEVGFELGAYSLNQLSYCP